MNEMVADVLVTIVAGAAVMAGVVITLLVVVRDRRPVVRGHDGVWRAAPRRR